MFWICRLDRLDNPPILEIPRLCKSRNNMKAETITIYQVTLHDCLIFVILDTVQLPPQHLSQTLQET